MFTENYPEKCLSIEKVIPDIWEALKTGDELYKGNLCCE